MRKPHLAGLLAFVAAVPATADPVRLDEAGLGGVAAGADAPAAIGIPNLSISDLTSTTNATDTRTSVFRQDAVGQDLRSVSDNANFATGINAAGVLANGSALSTVTGSVK
jgi:hypothetical protein